MRRRAGGAVRAVERTAPGQAEIHTGRGAGRGRGVPGQAYIALVTNRTESRRTVTVVFTDVTGSTGLGESLDPEAVRRVMERYFETASTVLARHGGTVEKFIGDAVMAVFGVPRLHEDDALRAVRAAGEMRVELAGLNAELRR